MTAQRSMLSDPASHHDVIHIEVTPADLNSSTAVMYCGASCWLDDTGAPTPYMDWYCEKGGHLSTCDACKKAWRTP